MRYQCTLTCGAKNRRYSVRRITKLEFFRSSDHQWMIGPFKIWFNKHLRHDAFDGWLTNTEWTKTMLETYAHSSDPVWQTDRQTTTSEQRLRLPAAGCLAPVRDDSQKRRAHATYLRKKSHSVKPVARRPRRCIFYVSIFYFYQRVTTHSCPLLPNKLNW